MKNVLVLGGTTFDSIIYLDKLPEQKSQTMHYVPFNETIGSTGAGKALNLAKLNVKHTLHSIIGADMYGEMIKKGLKDRGVDFVYDIDPRGTERHINLMDNEGNRISMFITQASTEPELNLKRLEELIKNCDIVVLNIVNYTKQLILLCQKYNKPVWTDLHDYDGENLYHEDYIEASDYIMLSSEKLGDDYRRVMEKLVKRGKKLVICTHGKKGSTCLTRDGKWIDTEIIKEYQLKDANGAGDSFFIGFLYGYINEKSVEECLRLGTICAGLCVTSKELAYADLSEKLLKKEYERFYGA